MPAFSQDSVWKKTIVDENMTISLPGNPLTIDTFVLKNNEKTPLRVLKVTTASSAIGVSVTTNIHLNVDNTESLEETYKGIEEGFRESAAEKGLGCEVTDTVIRKIPFKKTLLFSKTSKNNVKLFSWICLLNDKMYSITAFAPKGESEQSKIEMYRLIVSARFNSDLQEQKFSSKAESLGYKAGQLFGYASMLIIFGLIIFFVIRAITK